MSIHLGEAPFLECSTRGDRRFSAYCARIKSRGNRTIEEIYQAAKIFEVDGDFGKKLISGLSIKEAKGRQAVNQREVSMFYSLLWNEYISENPELFIVLENASGLSDIFGQEGHCCQSTELWKIKTSGICVTVKNSTDGGSWLDVFKNNA